MKTKVFLIPFVAAMLAVMLIGFVAAEDLVEGGDNGITTTFNDVELDSDDTTMAAVTGENVPVRVKFVGGEDMKDVKIKVEMEGYRDDIEASTSRFNVVEGSTYSRLLSLHLPRDIDDTTKEFSLYVSVVSADHKNEQKYTVKLQRDSYEFEVLSVDHASPVSAGESFPVSVVLKNTGFERMDDTYLLISVPELGVSTKGYVGDLIPTEDCEDDCEDEEDSMQKTVYLQVPENTQSGSYEMEITVYNKESATKVTKLLNVGLSGSTQVIATTKNQDINAGETKTYDLLVINSGDNLEVFNVKTVAGTGLVVSAPSVITVGPDSSETIPVTVTADNNADIGTYTFSVDVNGEQVLLGANVKGTSVSTSVVALTVILVIIFVVLLVVLIVLLTRKDKQAEEVETSYY